MFRILNEKEFRAAISLSVHTTQPFLAETLREGIAKWYATVWCNRLFRELRLGEGLQNIYPVSMFMVPNKRDMVLQKFFANRLFEQQSEAEDVELAEKYPHEVLVRLDHRSQDFPTYERKFLSLFASEWFEKRFDFKKFLKCPTMRSVVALSHTKSILKKIF